MPPGPRQIFWKVSLPSALPFIFAGLKIGIGRGLIGVVVAELFGSRAGLGQLISQSAETFNMPNLFAGVTVLAVAGIAMASAYSPAAAQTPPIALAEPIVGVAPGPSRGQRLSLTACATSLEAGRFAPTSKLN